VSEESHFEAVGEGRFRLVGELTFATVMALWREGTAQLTGGDGPLTVDLGQVERADSAGLALLIEWTREAERAKRPIQFHNVPRQMREIARVSSLDGILPFA